MPARMRRFLVAGAMRACSVLLAGAVAAVPASAGLAEIFVREAGGAFLELVGKAPALGSVQSPADTSSFSGCEGHFPRGAVLSLASVAPAWKPHALCSRSFAVLYSGLSKTPLVAVERLSRNGLAQARPVERTDEFFVDTRIPVSERSELEDFRGGRFDRGHLAAAGNQPDLESMAQSFALSNIVPQDPANNRKVWSKVEADVRK